MTSTRAALYGFALVAVLLAVFVGFGSRPALAGAATLEPCEATNPTGPIVELDGQLTLTPVRSTRRAWKRSGISQRVTRPASALTGRPTFPVTGVRYGKSARVKLGGGLRISHGRRAVRISDLMVVSPAGKPARIDGRLGRTRHTLFRVKAGKRTFNDASGKLSKVGSARLTAGGARVLNRNLRLRRSRLKAGLVWGYMNLYSLYKVTQVDDPTGEVPEVPPEKERPIEAKTVASAATVKWFVRDSFINYVASGEGTRVEDGATADAPSGPDHLVYSFNFPFDSGWTVPEAIDSPENTVIRGTGLVGFRYCHNTINFTAASPVIEIDGDANSRLIFTVHGTDGTAFPEQPAVMVKLIPSRAQSHTVVDNMNGYSTVTWEKIPGYVPAEGTGIFAGFYPAFSPDYEGQPQTERPDRFGYFSITYTFPNTDH